MKGGAARFKVGLEFLLVNYQHKSAKGEYKQTVIKKVDANFDTFSTRRNTFRELLYSYIPPAYKNRSEITSVRFIGTGDSGLPDYPKSMNQYLNEEAIESYNFISPLTSDYIDLNIEIILAPKKKPKTKTMGSKKKKKSKKRYKKKSKKRYKKRLNKSKKINITNLI